jgi:hypothetical protein
VRELIYRLLAWLTAAVQGPRTPGRHSRTDAPPAATRVAPAQPCPAVWGARLVNVRRRRDGYAWPAPWWEDTGEIVRPYVAHLGASPRQARVGVQVDPRGAAR